MADPLLRVHDVSCYFNLGRGQILRALDGVSLDIADGEILGLVGESGSGKSTLGKLVIGLNHKSAGWVEFAGRRLPDQYRSADFREQSGWRVWARAGSGRRRPWTGWTESACPPRI